MRLRWTVVLLCACGGTTALAPKAAEAPMHDTQALPTSTAPEPTPVTTTTAPPPKPIAVPSATASSAPDAGAGGALSKEECDKVIHTFAELVAKEQGASLMEGFQGNPIYGAMRSLCVMQTTRAQYECAVAAKTTQKWQECMK